MSRAAPPADPKDFFWRTSRYIVLGFATYMAKSERQKTKAKDKRPKTKTKDK